MHGKPRKATAATYPVTIETPYGVLRMAYEFDLKPCPDCGKHHGSVALLDMPPALRLAGAERFLELLPDFLAGLGELAYMNAFLERPEPSSVVMS